MSFRKKKYNFDLKLQIHEEKILLPYRKNSDPVLSGEKASNDVVIDIPEEYISELKSQTQQVEKYKVLLELSIYGKVIELSIRSYKLTNLCFM